MWHNADFLRLSLSLRLLQWSVGRVARQRSAKPRTAVRICYRPQDFLKASARSAGAFLVRANGACSDECKD